jgi:hypothetical protein
MTENLVFYLPAQRGKQILFLQYHYHHDRRLVREFVHTQTGSALRYPVLQFRIIYHNEFPGLGVIGRGSKPGRLKACSDFFPFNAPIRVLTDTLA